MNVEKYEKVYEALWNDEGFAPLISTPFTRYDGALRVILGMEVLGVDEGDVELPKWVLGALATALAFGTVDILTAEEKRAVSEALGDWGLEVLFREVLAIYGARVAAMMEKMGADPWDAVQWALQREVAFTVGRKGAPRTLVGWYRRMFYGRDEDEWFDLQL